MGITSSANEQKTSVTAVCGNFLAGKWKRERPISKRHSGSSLKNSMSVFCPLARLYSRLLKPGSEFLIEFVPTTIHGSPTCLEHMDLRWISLPDLPSLELAPSDRLFVDFLRSSL
jgi:hypothetical protein